MEFISSVEQRLQMEVGKHKLKADLLDYIPLSAMFLWPLFVHCSLFFELYIAGIDCRAKTQRSAAIRADLQHDGWRVGNKAPTIYGTPHCPRMPHWHATAAAYRYCTVSANINPGLPRAHGSTSGYIQWQQGETRGSSAWVIACPEQIYSSSRGEHQTRLVQLSTNASSKFETRLVVWHTVLQYNSY